MFKSITETVMHGVADLHKSSLYLPDSHKVETHSPKSSFVDPFALMSDLGMGFQEAPSNVTYATLKRMCEKDSIISSIINTRVLQVGNFCAPQRNKYSIGYRLVPKDPKKKLTQGEKDFIKSTESFLLNTGVNKSRSKDSFLNFVKKFARDTLYYDQACFEITYRNNGMPYEFFSVPSETIRLATPRTRKGAPTQKRQEDLIEYVQVIDGKIVTEYTNKELCFAVMNPRSDLKIYRYGFAPGEQLITTITSHLFAEQWNYRMFTQGATTKGILNFKGNISNERLEDFRRQWLMQLSGVANSWRMPIMASDGMEFVPLQGNNTEMGYGVWMEYLTKIMCAIFSIDPSEVNFDMRGGAGANAPMFMSTNEAQQKMSKDRGLQPLLRHIAIAVNTYLVEPLADWLEFEFAGLDAKTEEQAINLRITEASSYKTINEIRESEDLPPLKNGDIPLNPAYTGFLMQKEQMDMQKQQLAMQSGAAGVAGNPEGGPGEAGPAPDALFGPQAGQPSGPESETEDKTPSDGLKRLAGKSSDSDDSSASTEAWETSVHSGALKSDWTADLLKSRTGYDTHE